MDANDLNHACGPVLATPLHAAARAGAVEVVDVLLRHGADPLCKDATARTPYDVSKDKDTRDCFRLFMGAFPDAWAYDRAHIPSAATVQGLDEQAAKAKAKAEKEKEKKKRQKKAAAQRKKEQAEREREAEAKRAEERKASERDVRADAAAQRMKQQGKALRHRL